MQMKEVSFVPSSLLCVCVCAYHICASPRFLWAHTSSVCGQLFSSDNLALQKKPKHASASRLVSRSGHALTRADMC